MITDNIKNIGLYFNNLSSLEKAHDFIKDNINKLSLEKKYKSAMICISVELLPKPRNDQSESIENI